MLFHCCFAFIFANDKLFCKESVFSLWLSLRLSISGVLWFLSNVPTCGFAFIYLAEVLVCFFQEDSCLILENFHLLSFHICLYLSLSLGIWVYMYLNYHHILLNISMCLKWKGIRVSLYIVRS